VTGVVGGVPLEEQQALYELVLRYAQGADRRDYSGVGALFVPEGRIAGYRGDPDQGAPLYCLEGRAAIVEGLRGLERFEKTFHLVGNHRVEWGDSEATGETYCTAHHIHRVDSEPWDRTMAIRYQDRFTREPSGWFFVERLLVIDWESETPLGPGGWA